MSAIKLAAIALAIAQSLTFEVASVTSSKSDGVREFQIQPGGRLVISGMSLKDLVRRAYLASDAVQDENRVTGGPAWVSSDLFDIIAKADGDLGADSQGRPTRVIAMLRTLLEERFKVRTHTELREAAIYALVLVNKDGRVGKGLHPSTIDCPVFTQGVPRPVPDPVRWCGVRISASGNVRVTAQGVTMAELATTFAGFRAVSRPVQDKTGVSEKFDFQIEFAPTFPQSANQDPAPSGDAAGASFFTVIQEQLGLKLQATEAPVEFVVIDSAEHPTDN